MHLFVLDPIINTEQSHFQNSVTVVLDGTLAPKDKPQLLLAKSRMLIGRIGIISFLVIKN